MQVLSPSYSFVKFGSPEVENNCCDGDQEFCIPVIEENDTYFQLKITSEDYTEIQAMMAADITDFQLLLLGGSGNTAENFTDNILRDWTEHDALVFERYRTGSYEITLQWRSNLKDIKFLVDCGECFQIAMVRVNPDGFVGEFSDEFSDEFSIDGGSIAFDFVTISNCFKRMCDPCFTSVMEFYNEDDYAEFNYCNLTNPVNRVRMPFYLQHPKINEDKTVYRKSNGIIKQTKSLLTKEYAVVTEHFPEHIHDKITVALAHDFVSVVSGSYTGGISKNGEYVIDWSDNDCTAPASFKALATPYAIRNNNCQQCQVVAVCIPVAVPEFTLPNAYATDAYTHYEILTGTQPFDLSAVVKPSWMSIAIDEDTITFSGTPAVEAVDIAVTFTVSNECGSVNVSKTITTNPECIAVGIVGTPELPDGVNGLPYTYSFELSGTAPFELEDIVKPFWMTIEVFEDTIQFSGTPDESGEITGVSFTITNCVDSSIDFATDSADWSISYTNNDSSATVNVLVGNNGGSPTNTLFTGLYSSDPLTGTDSGNLPAINLSAILNVPGKVILSATCNGVAASGTGDDTVTWSGINGAPLLISFITE